METEKIKLNKYNSVAFWRVLFTFSIAIFHLGRKYPGFLTAYHTKNGWNIGVEFFFIVSGFLLAHKCRTSDLSALEYLKNRFQRLFPEYIFMTMYMIAFLCISTHKGLKGTALFIFEALDDVFLLQSTGICYTTINGVTWYLSSLIICGHFIYYMYKKWHDSFVTLVAPAAIIFIYSFLSGNYQKLAQSVQMTPIYVTKALLRGFAAMAIGVLAYELFLRCRKIHLTKVGKLCATCIEILDMSAYSH
jgi:peptidoglycan/LPS O-acetylase OafA/YrhL